MGYVLIAASLEELAGVMSALASAMMMRGGVPTDPERAKELRVTVAAKLRELAELLEQVT